MVHDASEARPRRRLMIQSLLGLTLDTKIDKKFIKNYKVNLFRSNFNHLCSEIRKIQNCTFDP